MNSLSEKSRLITPGLTLDALSFCEASQKSTKRSIEQSIKQWLNQLPKADKQQSALQLNVALKELTQLRIVPTQHWLITELFFPAVYYLTRQIKTQNLDGYTLFSDTQQHSFDTCLQLLNDLLSVYKTIFENNLDASELESLSGATLHRAMTINLWILQLHLEFYRPAPEGFWLALHKTYEAAAYTQHLSFKWENKLILKGHSLSVETLYKHILLLGHAHTRQLSPEEISHVSRALALWAPHTRLEKPGINNAHFFLHLSSDVGLQYMLTNRASSDERIVTLDSRKLAAHLRKLKESITEEKNSTISKGLLSHLASVWSPPIKRKHRRQESAGECRFCYGFDQVHYCFSKQPFDNMVRRYKTTTDCQHHAFADSSSSDIWASAFASGLNDREIVSSNTYAINYSSSPQTVSTENTTDSSLISNASIVNTSADGYCLRFTTPQKKQIKVGQLAAIQEQGGSWLLAVIRWLHIDGRNSIQVGLELLAAKTTSCAIAPLKKTTKDAQFQRALLVSAQPPISKTPTLITPHLNFQKGLKFELLQEGGIHKGQLLDCVSNTPGFSQFQFRFFKNTL